MPAKKPAQPPAHRGVKCESVTNIRATRGFNVGKGVASTTITVSADVPPTVADRVMELAQEGAPLYVVIATDQGTLFTPPQEPEGAEPEGEEQPE